MNRLCLRQNHIKTLDPEVMKALVNLSELDMYDNKIKDVGEALDSLVNVTYVIHLYVWSNSWMVPDLLLPLFRLQDT